MRKPLLILLSVFTVACLTACATEEPREREPRMGDREIWEKLGCAEDQVALCIAVHCGEDDWVCADRSALRDLFSPHRSN